MDDKAVLESLAKLGWGIKSLVDMVEALDSRLGVLEVILGKMLLEGEVPQLPPVARACLKDAVGQRCKDHVQEGESDG